MEAVEETYYERYEKTKREIEEWCQFSRATIEGKSMQAVNMKQWIAARLHDAKRERLDLLRLKGKLKKIEVERIIQTSPVNLDKSILDKLNSFPTMEAISDKLEDLELLIKYFEDMVKMFMYIAQDVKNVIDAIKLEIT